MYQKLVKVSIKLKPVQDLSRRDIDVPELGSISKQNLRDDAKRPPASAATEAPATPKNSRRIHAVEKNSEPTSESIGNLLYPHDSREFYTLWCGISFISIKLPGSRDAAKQHQPSDMRNRFSHLPHGKSHKHHRFTTSESKSWTL